MSKHEGVRYLCDKCDYTGTQGSNLRKRFGSKHEGSKLRHSTLQLELTILKKKLKKRKYDFLK